MPFSRSRPQSPRAGAALLCALLTGCAFGYRDKDVDRTPIVNTGAGATIIMPGQEAPRYSPGSLTAGPAGGTLGGAPAQAAPGAGGGTAPDPGAGAAAGGAGSGGVSFLGGAETDEVRHQQVDEAPIWSKYLTLPFALLAAPFGAAAEAIQGERQPGPEAPRPTTAYAAPAPQATRAGDDSNPLPQASFPSQRSAPRRETPRGDYDSARLQDLERELDARGGEPTARGLAPGAAPRRSTPSIADELAALERGAAEPPAPRAGIARGEPVQPSSASSHGPGQADRDGDGRVDQWIHRENGQIVRERLDDDFDGRPERTLVYDRASGEVTRIEEDLDQDGRIDAWSEYQAGHLTSRRSDENRDGRVETWTAYHEGEVARIERDSNGDGAPDYLGFYGAGQLTREERDVNGDGSPDLVLRYDGSQRLATREEDTDGDGRLDVISHYEGGRLARREVIDAADVAGAGQER